MCHFLMAGALLYVRRIHIIQCTYTHGHCYTLLVVSTEIDPFYLHIRRIHNIIMRGTPAWAFLCISHCSQVQAA